MKARTIAALICLPLLFALGGCSRIYYATWEKLGKEKRDLLRDNVVKVKDRQRDAQEQFTDALTRLKGLTQWEGGDLENAYEDLKKDHERCVAKADAVRDRVRKVDDIAEDLFDEWDDEIGQISNASMREQSRRKLDETRKRYDGLAKALHRSEASMDPVLTKLNDQVLFLKHNLNAAAIGGLKAEMQSIETDVEALVRDIEASIAKGDEFIATLPEG